ncbi:hypothetical protein [Kitasatospora sp. GP82]|uniref:hypothetical protein n=1 Tax=Kitasatospora sp. GP82 TaxID=3035089 RepID=UPI002475C77E|nr:hypothetical protein [Kitasatospora sp. GP82]
MSPGARVNIGSIARACGSTGSTAVAAGADAIGTSGGRGRTGTRGRTDTPGTGMDGGLVGLGGITGRSTAVRAEGGWTEGSWAGSAPAVIGGGSGTPGTASAAAEPRPVLTSNEVDFTVT